MSGEYGFCTLEGSLRRPFFIWRRRMETRRLDGWPTDEELMKRYGLTKEHLAILRADPRSQRLSKRVREFFEQADDLVSEPTSREL